MVPVSNVIVTLQKKKKIAHLREVFVSRIVFNLYNFEKDF